MTRDRLVVFVFALLAGGAAIGFGLLFSSLGCSANASCPAQAKVNGTDYGVSGAKDLPGVNNHLVAAIDATGTRAAPYLAEPTLFSVGAVDPTLILIGRAAPDPNENSGEFVVLFSIERSREAWDQLCTYVDSSQAGAATECTHGSVTPGTTSSQEPQ